MTATKLKDRRRRDKIEYDMERFQYKAKEFPKFSERPDIPFWIDESKAPHEAPIAASIPRTLSEPAFKVHEVPFGDDSKESHNTLPESAYRTAAGLPAKVDMTQTSKDRNQGAYGARTKKRFAAEMIERGFARNQPRLFDSLQPLHTGPKDMESLDVQSSLETIRVAAIKKNNEQRKRNAENPRRSMMWSDSSGMQHSTSVPSQDRGLNDSALGTPIDGMTSMEAPRQSQGRASMGMASSAGPTMRTAARVHHVMSVTDSTQRAPGQQANIEAAREPRHMLTRSASDGGVRCGGFHRLDFHGSFGPRPAAETRDKKRTGKDHSTSTGSAQPL